MVSLCETWELVWRGQIFVARGSVNSVWEENVIVDIDVLSDWLIWVQRGKFSFNDSLCTWNGCIDKVLVHFHIGTIFLDSVHVGFSVKGSDSLEFFIPLPVWLGIATVGRCDCLAHCFRSGHLDLLLILDKPWVDCLSDRWDKVWLTLKDRCEVDL